jgi:hypothetical protein
MGKKIKKVVKKVVKTVANPVGSILGGNRDQGAVSIQEPTPAAPAAVVEAPKEDASDDSGKDTEAARKAARARGKRGLSVARASGTGINI